PRCLGATAPPSAPSRSPRARAPRAAHAAPRARAAGRRSARGSLGDELEAVGDVPDLPALALDLTAQAIGLVEIPTGPCFLPPLREVDELRGRHDRLGQGPQPEQLQAPTQGGGSAAGAPVVEERQGLRGVEVVVEDAGKRVA